MQSQKDFIKTALRVPSNLHCLVHKGAKENGRSFNAEVLYRLEKSYEKEKPQVLPTLRA